MKYSFSLNSLNLLKTLCACPIMIVLWDIALKPSKACSMSRRQPQPVYLLSGEQSAFDISFSAVCRRCHCCAAIIGGSAHLGLSILHKPLIVNFGLGIFKDLRLLIGL
jgi:hypothetical protein